jgi:hypothetical protein
MAECLAPVQAFFQTHALDDADCAPRQRFFVYLKVENRLAISIFASCNRKKTHHQSQKDNPVDIRRAPDAIIRYIAHTFKQPHG